MSAHQPEALRLADQLKDRYGATVPTSQAAAELRRLHAINAEMVEALKTAVCTLEMFIPLQPGHSEAQVIIDARAAIAKATGQEGGAL